MPKEIERKFLVSFDHISFVERIDPRVIQQGYIRLPTVLLLG